MQARTAFEAARISKNVVAVFVALLLLAFLLGGAGGYLVKGVSLPVASRTQAAMPQAYAISDASTGIHRGGPQTVDAQSPSRTAASNPAPRHSGLQLP
jgi:hypothetical protein